MRRIALAWMLAAGASAAVSATLTLHFQERPPYSSEVEGGRVVGLVAAPAERALRQAEITFRWTQTPSQRQLALIQAGRGMHCGVGWFRTPEREALGKFSAELYRDRSFGALVRTDVPLAARLRAVDLVATTRLRPLLKEGYSYGRFLDSLLHAATRPAERTSADPPQMAGMLLAGRADWMIAAPEEAAALLQPGLRPVEFSDAPPGASRHLYCSRDVPDDWLIRIDRALAAPAR